MWVADLSSGWPSLTGAVLKGLGCSGVIGYIGCDYAPKNVSKDRVWDWYDSGLMVGLVIENGPQDMLGGDKAGAYLGQNWLRGAEAVGYDVEHYVGYTPADWNVQPAQYAAVEDAFGAFASYVPVHGLYGPGPLLNQTTAHGLWNSNSTSFGAVSPRACLVQHYNDPRAQGHALDVNDVISQPLYFMGEQVTSPADNAAAVWGQPIAVPAEWQPTSPPSPFRDAAWVLSQTLTLVTELVNTPPPSPTLTDAQIQALASAIVAQLPAAPTADQIAEATVNLMAGVPILVTSTIGAKTA